VNFLFTAPGERAALIGVMARSEDRVGRSFPLCVFHVVDGAATAARLGEIPISYGAFLRGAATLLSDAVNLSPQEIAARLQALESASRGDFALAGAELGLFRAAAAEPHVRPLSASRLPGNVFYGLRTFAMACRAERGKEPSKPSVMLDVPLPEDGDPRFWLELAQQLLAWKTLPPALFWAAGPAPRLLLCVGTPAPSVLMHLARPEHAAMKLWPLHTQQASAVDAARQALTGEQRAAIEAADTPVGELVKHLTS
ncbi:MAG TPA: TagF domain-containing protein, partial [Myxococcaceae bacterium]|nr:TagF domain-containing protein [Myxococcaceae bacterium]